MSDIAERLLEAVEKAVDKGFRKVQANVGDTVVWQSRTGPTDAEFRGQTTGMDGWEATLIVRPEDSPPYQITVDADQVKKKSVEKAKDSTYRGVRIEGVEGATQVGHSTNAGTRARVGIGTSRKVDFYIIHWPEEHGGGTSNADTLKAAKQRIDSYLGDEKSIDKGDESTSVVDNGTDEVTAFHGSEQVGWLKTDGTGYVQPGHEDALERMKERLAELGHEVGEVTLEAEYPESDDEWRTKAWRGIREAGFQLGDKIFPTGAVHDRSRVPAQYRNDPKLLGGFITTAGKFVTRAEAARMTGMGERRWAVGEDFELDPATQQYVDKEEQVDRYIALGKDMVKRGRAGKMTARDAAIKYAQDDGRYDLATIIEHRLPKSLDKAFGWDDPRGLLDTDGDSHWQEEGETETGGKRYKRKGIPKEAIEREWKDADGYWISLKDGWTDKEDPGVHSIHERTKRDAYRHQVTREGEQKSYNAPLTGWLKPGGGFVSAPGGHEAVLDAHGIRHPDAVTDHAITDLGWVRCYQEGDTLHMEVNASTMSSAVQWAKRWGPDDGASELDVTVWKATPEGTELSGRRHVALAKSLEKGMGILEQLQEIVDRELQKEEKDEKDGVLIYYHPDRHHLVIDVMDWGNSDIGKAIGEAAAGMVDKLEYQNEGPTWTKEGDGWEDVGKSLEKCDHGENEGMPGPCPLKGGTETGGDDTRSGPGPGEGKRRAPGSQLEESHKTKLRELGMVGTFPPADVPLDRIKMADLDASLEELKFKPLMQWDQTSKNKRTGRQYRYTQEFHDRNAREKFDRVMAVEPYLAEAKGGLLKKMVDGDDGAAIASLILETGLRPTDGAESVKHGHFGIASLQARHVKDKGDRIELDFIGKEGVRNHTVVKDKNNIAYLRTKLEDKKPKDKLWDAGSNKAGDALKEVVAAAGGPEDVKLKDLRTLKATQYARKVVGAFKGPPPPLSGNQKKDEKMVAKAILEMAGDVAKVLNNTASMARDNYVHPDIWASWKKSLGGE